ncbi:RecB family exonuclease [Microbacterium enclense]|uniref:RecB family exonuclease n=1 Tax=Microbacterium enclense TaxID=993073 RepID=UPI003F7E3A87
MTTTAPNQAKRPSLEGSSWDGNVLVIDDPEALRKIRRREISPSSASNIRKCEASFAAESLLPKPNDPFQPRLIGTGAHEAMEHLFQLPPSERTTEFLHEDIQQIGGRIWSTEQLTDPARRRLLLPDAEDAFIASQEITDELAEANIRASERWRGIVEPWSLGIFRMTGQPHPRDVEVYGTELAVGGFDYEAKKPNEVTLSLRGLRGDFPVQGKIDRTDWVTLDDGKRGLSVRDFKFSGSRPRKPRSDGDDYAEQQRIYTLFFKALHPDLPVVDAALLYPGWDHVRNIDISDEALHGTLRMFEKAWIDMNRAVDTHKFSTKPSNLCGWCPLANACPVARMSTEKAAAEAATKSPGTALGITVTRETPKVTAWAQNGDYSRMPRLLLADVPAPQTTHRQKGSDNAPASGQNQEETPETMSTPIAAAPTPVAPLFKFPADNYGPMAAFGIVDAATEHLAEHGQQLAASSISALARVLADIAFQVTRSLYGAAAWNHGAVGRVAFAVKSAIGIRPAPFGQDAAAWEHWKRIVIGLTTAKTKAAQSLLDNPEADATAALGFLAAA